MHNLIFIGLPAPPTPKKLGRGEGHTSLVLAGQGEVRGSGPQIETTATRDWHAIIDAKREEARLPISFPGSDASV